MRVAIMGLGSIGMRHARIYKQLGADVSGFDPTEDRRARFESELGGSAHGTESDLLTGAPDLVAITSPNIYHIPQALRAVENCKALFIEKPLGTDYEAALQFARVVKDKGCYVHVGSNWKFHPAFECMKRWLEEGKLGLVTGVQVVAGQWLPDWHPWEDFRQMYAARKALGGGAIFDTHELDYLRWLFGPVDEFIGFKHHSGALPIETEDVATCMLRFSSGALGVLLTDYIQRVPRRRYSISGSEGSIEWDLREGTVVLSRSGEPVAEQVDARLDDINEMYVKQAKRILSDVQGGGKPVTGIDDVMDILRLQNAWHRQELVRQSGGQPASVIATS